MIRTLYTIVLLILFAFTQVMAQHTFDVKYPNDTIGAPFIFNNLYRITSDKVLAFSNDSWRKPIFITFDNNGIISKEAKLEYMIRGNVYYWYNRDNNLIYTLLTEDMAKKVDFPCHLITMDTNLKIIVDKRLDSSVTLVSKNQSIASITNFFPLRDSTLLTSIIHSEKKGTEFVNTCSITYRFSKLGVLLNSHKFNEHTTYDEALIQKENGDILWCFYPDSFQVDNQTFRISDSTLNFKVSEKIELPYFTNGSYDRKSIISTRQNGFVLLHIPDSTYGASELIRYDSKFGKLWQAKVLSVNPDAQQIIESESGSFYIVTQSFTDTSLGNYEDCWLDIVVTKLDANGDHVFTAVYGNGKCQQVPFAVTEDTDGGIIISAHHNKTGTGVCEFTCNERDSNWIFKIDTMGRTARTVTGINEQPEISSLRFYPNPTNSEIRIESDDVFSSIEIVSLMGENIYHRQNNSYDKDIIINTENLPVGTYYCRIKTTSSTIVKQFIVQH